MPAIVGVVGVLVIVVVALLAVDWFTAGRTKGRLLFRARDGSESDLNVNYTHHEQTVRGIQHWDQAP